jgi:GNAT superfamily N-acetyltransferase
METYEFSTDRRVAKSFYDRVKNNVVRLMPSRDPDSPDLVRQPCFVDLDLFRIKELFLGCVSYAIDGEVAGLICIAERQGKAYVDSGYVADRYRKHGVGSKLLRMACDKLIEIGKTPIYLVVRSKQMDSLVDKLSYPAGIVQKLDVSNDYDDLHDCLFTDQERPPEP